MIIHGLTYDFNINAIFTSGPGFRDNKPEHRLCNTDASVVDIVHSDMAVNALRGLGLNIPIGDIDFMPNGGRLQVLDFSLCATLILFTSLVVLNNKPSSPIY